MKPSYDPMARRGAFGRPIARWFALPVVVLCILALCACDVLPTNIPTGTEQPTATPDTAPLETLTPEPIATPAPTPEPTPTPTDEPISTPEPTQAADVYVPSLESGFYDYYFNDAVFVGDSVSAGLQNYVIYRRSLGEEHLMGEARFLAITNYNLYTASRDFNPNANNYTYQGVAMTLENCLAAMGAGSAYVMLGLNDWAATNVNTCIKEYRTAIGKILEANPGIDLVIEMCTPITSNGETSNLHNAGMDEFNARLRELCDELGVGWVDVATPLKGADNCLVKEYSSDDYVHMTNSGLRVWINTLRTYARERYIQGAWELPAGLDPLAYEGEYLADWQISELLIETVGLSSSSLDVSASGIPADSPAA